MSFRLISTSSVRITYVSDSFAVYPFLLRVFKKIICMRTINKKYCCGIQVAGVQPRAELRRPGQL